MLGVLDLVPILSSGMVERMHLQNLNHFVKRAEMLGLIFSQTIKKTKTLALIY